MKLYLLIAINPDCDRNIQMWSINPNFAILVRLFILVYSLSFST